MWTCPKCGEQHDDQFESCWKCEGSGTAPDGTPVSPSAALRCPRCPATLGYMGTKNFHEGGAWSVLFGSSGELFEHRESFDVYACPRCGRVEFFVSGIGDELRPQ